MAQITITIPDAVIGRVQDAFASEYGWDPAGGQTKAQFAKTKIMAHIRETVVAAEAKAAGSAAANTAATAALTDVVLS